MSDLGELLEDLDIESWLDYEGIKYKLARGTRGIQANIRECPVCGNSKWKVYFGTETGLGNCFVCEAKFTKWKFITAHLAVSNADAARYIEGYMKSQSFRPEISHSATVQKDELRLPESLPLPINGRNLKYLTDRQISLELAEYFGLRYCHQGRFNFTDPHGRKSFQDYSKRIIIPIFDETGKLASFQGRDITGLAEKKYLFPPGFAASGSIIYNGHNAQSASRLVVGEGVFDCFAIKAAIDADPEQKAYAAVASFGKKLSYEQLLKLRAWNKDGKLKSIVFMWDAERTAIDAAVDAALECKSHGIDALVALLPKDKDPNEVEPEVVREAIRTATAINSLSAVSLKLKAQKFY